MGEHACTLPGRVGDGEGRWKVGIDSRMKKAVRTWDAYGLGEEIKSSSLGRLPALECLPDFECAF